MSSIAPNENPPSLYRTALLLLLTAAQNEQLLMVMVLYVAAVAVGIL